MRRFLYKATDPETGKNVKGVIQAETEQAAGKLLIAQGLAPDTIEAEDMNGWLAKMQNKVTPKDKITFTRQFATLIGAGLPLSNALRTVNDQTSAKGMKIVIEEVLADVESGKSLTDACAKHPEVFDRVYLALVQAGEMSGTLDLSLKRLADQQEKDAAVMAKIRGALTSPLITLAVIIAVMVFLMIEVVPQVEDLYVSLDKELPSLTSVMVAGANFLMHQWYVILVMVVLIVWFVIWFLRTNVGIRWMAVFKLNVPMFKGLFLRLYNGRFARTMQNLMSTGVALLDSMQISAEAMNNIVLQEQIEEAEKKVRAGKPLSEALQGADYMLPLVPQMAAIGEESGKMDEMLGKAAKVYEDELDEQVARISEMIEPVMMVAMGGMAGMIVAGILFPIYSLVGSIG
ncbi:type II secretion system F family protein [Candidatus Saccharibacteria bacterium]|nr:type II secretion system F family protein [Candidatus Saccharibacteria bacterium]MBR1795966.1 type II secretion system F family protein [Candidatus Saccharibacteria bacterium]